MFKHTFLFTFYPAPDFYKDKKLLSLQKAFVVTILVVLQIRLFDLMRFLSKKQHCNYFLYGDDVESITHFFVVYLFRFFS